MTATCVSKGSKGSKAPASADLVRAFRVAVGCIDRLAKVKRSVSRAVSATATDIASGITDDGRSIATAIDEMTDAARDVADAIDAVRVLSGTRLDAEDGRRAGFDRPDSVNGPVLASVLQSLLGGKKTADRVVRTLTGKA